ncbi:hypothetical protein Acr_13g0001810 [Actinidia rufa]|uniref:Uncharacterized protein n=1 Tax=Actinidia rufa TaxID=165716 RepID=A0A7J0FJB4_9ERIC|nr:hypothetical protein Acr_13g0001810 [Actinidia rufa]
MEALAPRWDTALLSEIMMKGKSNIETYGSPTTEMGYWHQSAIVPDPSSGAVIASILLYSDSLIMTVVQTRDEFYFGSTFTELRHRDPPSSLRSDSSQGDSLP